MQRVTFTVVIADETPALRLSSAKDALGAGLGVNPELIEVSISGDVYPSDIPYIAIPRQKS